MRVSEGEGGREKEDERENKRERDRRKEKRIKVKKVEGLLVLKIIIINIAYKTAFWCLYLD